MVAWAIPVTKAAVAAGVAGGAVVGAWTTKALYETGIQRPGGGSLLAPLLIAGVVAKSAGWI